MIYTQSVINSQPRLLQRVGRDDGFTLIEVLVTIVILMIGLLGVLNLQARSSNVEFESYQRGQALTLAREMAARVSGARGSYTGFVNAAVSSTDGSVFVGTGSGAEDFADTTDPDNPTCVSAGADALSVAKFEMCQWQLALQGTAVTDNGGNAGAMIGANGCLIRVNPATAGALADFFVVVIWQGTAPRADAPGMIAGEEPSPISECAPDVDFGSGLRRGVVVRVLVPDLVKAS